MGGPPCSHPGGSGRGYVRSYELGRTGPGAGRRAEESLTATRAIDHSASAHRPRPHPRSPAPTPAKASHLLGKDCYACPGPGPTLSYRSAGPTKPALVTFRVELNGWGLHE